MFNLQEIKEIIQMMDQSTLQELEIQNEGSKLFLRKSGTSVTAGAGAGVQHPDHPLLTPEAGQAAAVTVPELSNESNPIEKAGNTECLHQIVSPMVGTFYHAASPEAPPFVQAGDKVAEKTVVCIVEAMKLMNEIEAEVKGEVVQALVENGQLVEYGQPLFLIRT